MSASVSKRWCKRIGKLNEQLPEQLARCRREGSAEVVHDLRVMLRRARAYARVGKPALPHHQFKRFGAWSKQGVPALSAIRDLDITLEWLARRQHAPDLSEQLLGARRERWRHARPLLRDLAKSFAPLETAEVPRKRFERLTHRLVKAAQKERAVVCGQRRAMRNLTSPQLHAFRKHVRRLRYLLELAVPKQKQERHPGLTALIALQDALGEHQNGVVRQRLFSKLAQPILTRPLLPVIDAGRAQALRRAEGRLRRVKELFRRPSSIYVVYPQPGP